ncbi:DUF1127 domain-containing protein [Kiloniella laminariae]|uniref:DUF1127 domain-containing protein n=1 Tax=Kiloniella laminariae TaxID=454162 RepID=UPI000369D50A|nr:DUF1127 domain-containing protein [Kiloniella laminariae]
MKNSTLGFSAATKARTEIANAPVLVTVAPHRYTKAYRIYAAVSGIVESFKNYMERRATVRQLWDLNDRELNDIGLSRGNIEATVNSLYAEAVEKETKSFKPGFAFLSSSDFVSTKDTKAAENLNKAARAA